MRASFIAAAAARSSRFADKPALPLDYFVNRTKALALYRQFIRATKSLGDARTRWETMEWIRNDFERNRAVVDSEKCKTLLSLGHRQLKQLGSTSSLIGGNTSKFRGGRRA